MSRVARGGSRGGGRGGRSKAGNTKIAGVEIAYDEGLEESLRHRPQPTPLFPDYKPAPPWPLSRAEQAGVTKFLSIRRAMHDGTLYAVSGLNAGRGKNVNPFDGMQAYSSKYIKRKRTIPRLDTQPRALKFFPRELWEVLDVAYRPTKEEIAAAKALEKALGQSREDEAGSREAEAKENRGKTGLDEIGDEEEKEEEKEGGGGEQAEEEPPEEEYDDEYGSDEEEMAGDYNAEQYFDNGGDDAGDDYDAGEAAGADFD